MTWREWSTIGNPDARAAELDRLNDAKTAFVALWDPVVGVRFTASDVLARATDETVRGWVISVALGDFPEGAIDTFGENAIDVPQRVAATLGLRRESFTDQERAAIHSLANDVNGNVRYHAFLAAHEALDPTDKRLLAASGIEDDDDDVLIVTIQWAAQYGWDDLFQLGVDRMLQTGDKEVRLHLAVSLAELGGRTRSTPELVQVLELGLRHEPSARSCAIALAALGQHSSCDSLNGVLLRFWFHRLVRVEAASALAALGDDRGNRALVGFADSKHEDAANYALERIAHYNLTNLRDVVERNQNRDLTRDAATDVLGRLS